MNQESAKVPLPGRSTADTPTWWLCPQCGQVERYAGVPPYFCTKHRDGERQLVEAVVVPLSGGSGEVPAGLTREQREALVEAVDFWFENGYTTQIDSTLEAARAALRGQEEARPVPEFEHTQACAYARREGACDCGAAQRRRSGGAPAQDRPRPPAAGMHLEGEVPAGLREDDWLRVNVPHRQWCARAERPAATCECGAEELLAKLRAALRGQEERKRITHDEIMDGEIAYSEELGRVFLQLLDACAAVPVKQRSRTPEQQQAVEAFTAAVVEARRFARGQEEPAADERADTRTCQCGYSLTRSPRCAPERCRIKPDTARAD